MNIVVFLHEGPAAGEIVTLRRAEVPTDLRVAVTPPDGRDEAEVAVYRLVASDQLELSTVGAAASYRFQGTKPSAWSLVDLVVE